MRTVRITHGTYGYRPEGSRHVMPVRRGEQIKLPDSEAGRLIQLGVASVVIESPPGIAEIAVATGSKSQNCDSREDNTTGTDNGAENAESAEDDMNSGEDETNETPEYSADMKVDQLRGLMKQFSIPFKAGMTKADMVTALDAYFADAATDEEYPPDIQAEGPVA